MSLTPYARVLGDSRTRLVLVLGILVRIPPAASGLIVTLHVVAMGHPYAAAGLATMALTAGLAISGPWRGRLLDQHGLRRVVLPSLGALTVCWLAAPHLGYLPLVLDCLVAGLFAIPSFSIIRQAIMVAVPGHDRRTALALDAVAVEVSFMIGPLLGVWAATVWDTGTVLAAVGVSGVVAGVLLLLADPPLRSAASGTVVGEDADPDAGAAAPAAPGGSARWFTPAVGALCAAAAATTLVLGGTDLSVVAAMRAFEATDQLGVVLALWCLGSLVGGLVYGAQRHAVPALWLVFGLGAVTLPAAWSRDVATLTVLVIVAGLLCAPTSTALVDQLGRIVPEGRRGEAMGWQGSFMQVGVAVSGPVAGLAIDRGGYGAGFASVAVVGMLIAAAGLALRQVRRRRAAALAASR